MSDSFTPRTVVVVALASLVGGFVTVFGGGMIAMRSRRPAAPVVVPSAVASADDAGTVDDAAAPESPAAPEGPAAPESPAAPAAPEAPAAPTANVTFEPFTVSRCFAGMAPIPIPGARCDRLPALDQHFQSRAAQVAACAQGAHGRLAFVMDLRFSTQHVGAWGGPSSTVANAGVVAQCVRRATAPLPLATVPHANDRYIVAVNITW